jgi:hypothetical protein
MLPMSAILNVMTWWPSWIKVIYKVLYWWVQVMKCMTFHNLSFTFVLSIYKLNLAFINVIPRQSANMRGNNYCDCRQKCDFGGFRQMLLLFFCIMVFNATFNNISVISWWSVLYLLDCHSDYMSFRIPTYMYFTLD